MRTTCFLRSTGARARVRAAMALGLSLCSSLGACSEDERPDTQPTGEAVGARDGSVKAKPDAARPAGGGSSDRDGKAADAGPAPTSATDKQLPCDVQAVLDEHCVSCHAAGTPQFGAPMSLASLADLHLAAPREKVATYEAVAERIQRDGAGAMPPSPRPGLSDAERATLLAWAADGAPGSDETCRAPDAPAPEAGEPEAPVDGTDCEVSFELRAHDKPGQGGGKFPIPAEDDHYECFYFNAADTGVDESTLATSLAPLLDDTRVLHHWLLFASENENESPSGTHRRCDGIHPGAFLMAAWLPGTPALVLPKDVGMEFPKTKTAQFILENHYNNTARYQGASDDSGVKVCATKKPKAQHAAMHWLGSERITLAPGSKGSAAATCIPKSQEPIHILGVIPHMHRLGRHVNMTITRKDGSTEVLHEGAFEFESQGYFPKQVVLQPGDKVRTQCDYLNDTSGVVTLGEKTTQEMCYMFTLAYPIGSMNTGGDLLNPLSGQPVVQGPNRCMR
jgi:mono/diheme cytochrome c family protein